MSEGQHRGIPDDLRAAIERTFDEFSRRGQEAGAGISQRLQELRPATVEDLRALQRKVAALDRRLAKLEKPAARKRPAARKPAARKPAAKKKG